MASRVRAAAAVVAMVAGHCLPPAAPVPPAMRLRPALLDPTCPCCCRLKGPLRHWRLLALPLARWRPPALPLKKHCPKMLPPTHRPPLELPPGTHPLAQLRR